MVDLTNVKQFPHIRAISATTNNTEIVLPPRTKVVTVATKTGECVFAYEGVDNNPPSSNAGFVANYGYVATKYGRGKDRPTSLYVAMVNGTGTIIIILEDE